MSKRGSPYLRRAIWIAAAVAAFNDPVLSEFYLKEIDTLDCFIYVQFPGKSCTINPPPVINKAIQMHKTKNALVLPPGALLFLLIFSSKKGASLIIISF
jgi:hypothetical protein